jgi:pSer/pThr/pTyr-binding forkhead associated (FHA) protein
MARLILHPGTPRVREFPLKDGTSFLGRDAGNDVTVDDVTVSGAHAQIVVDGPSAIVTDLGSSNGTFIDREPITEAVLHSGQWLRLGGVEMLFEADPIVEELSLTGGSEPEVVSPVRIRVPEPTPVAQTSASPGTPFGAPPIAPRIPVAATRASSGGKSVCKFHPKAQARWRCPQCGQLYCDLCVNSRRTAEGHGYFCRPCGVQCAAVEAPAIVFDDSDDESFYAQLPGAFIYPFKSGVGFVLVCMAIFFAVVGFFARFFCIIGVAMQLFSLGYVFLYMQNIIQSTVQGDDREPQLPDVTNIVEDVILPGLQLLATIIFCFGPAIGLAMWRFSGGPELAMWLVFPALAVGCVYFPMAFLAMAMFDSVGAISPMVVIPAITKIPLEYLVACACLGVVFAVRWGGAMLLGMAIPIPVVPALISDVVGLYFLAVQCRILGLLYYANRGRFGWMRH